jgi:hypothetical protein
LVQLIGIRLNLHKGSLFGKNVLEIVITSQPSQFTCLCHLGRHDNQGSISCHFLLPGGSKGPRHVLQHLVLEKFKIAQNSTTIKGGEKIGTNLKRL